MSMPQYLETHKLYMNEMLKCSTAIVDGDRYATNEPLTNMVTTDDTSTSTKLLKLRYPSNDSSESYITFINHRVATALLLNEMAKQYQSRDLSLLTQRDLQIVDLEGSVRQLTTTIAELQQQLARQRAICAALSDVTSSFTSSTRTLDESYDADTQVSNLAL